nr:MULTISPECIES: hypothetical protein [Calothrix]
MLIAAIENQVAEISDRVPSGFIKSIQANLIFALVVCPINFAG